MFRTRLRNGEVVGALEATCSGFVLPPTSEAPITKLEDDTEADAKDDNDGNQNGSQHSFRCSLVFHQFTSYPSLGRCIPFCIRAVSQFRNLIQVTGTHTHKVASVVFLETKRATIRSFLDAFDTDINIKLGKNCQWQKQH